MSTGDFGSVPLRIPSAHCFDDWLFVWTLDSERNLEPRETQAFGNAIEIAATVSGSRMMTAAAFVEVFASKAPRLLLRQPREVVGAAKQLHRLASEERGTAPWVIDGELVAVEAGLRLAITQQKHQSLAALPIRMPSAGVIGRLVKTTLGPDPTVSSSVIKALEPLASSTHLLPRVLDEMTSAFFGVIQSQRGITDGGSSRARQLRRLAATKPVSHFCDSAFATTRQPVYQVLADLTGFLHRAVPHPSGDPEAEAFAVSVGATAYFEQSMSIRLPPESLFGPDARLWDL